MKKLILLATLGAASGLSLAQGAGQEMARVLSSTPIVEQVAVPQQVCNTVPVTVQNNYHGSVAPVVGAVIGGASGNMIGRGTGRTLATMAGVLSGAIIGNEYAQRHTQPQVQYTQQCSSVNRYDSRTVGYNVVYEYAGRQYSTQMSYDPGRYIPVSVSPNSGSDYGHDNHRTQNMYRPSPVVVNSPAVVEQGVSYAPPAPAYVQQPAYVQPQSGLSNRDLLIGAAVAAPFIYRIAHPR